MEEEPDPMIHVRREASDGIIASSRSLAVWQACEINSRFGTSYLSER
jgi:hypothetical protein